MTINELFDSDFLKNLSIAKVGYTGISQPLSWNRYDAWTLKEKHFPLSYMGDHRKELRKDLKKYFPKFKSALVFAFDYSEKKKELESFYKSKDSNGLKISSYVFGFEGDDYHNELRTRMESVLTKLKERYPNLESSFTLDIHPVLERDLAYRSGIGWFGKNSMLINREFGSFFLIGSLLLDIELDIEEESPVPDHCGNCTACADACPTDAIDLESRTIESSQCISTWTIELFKDAPPISGHKGKGGGEIFGCDICQDVCPWNKKHLEKLPVDVLEGEKTDLLMDFFLKRAPSDIKNELESMSTRGFARKFKKTPLERTGRVGLLKNIKLYTD